MIGRTVAVHWFETMRCPHCQSEETVKNDTATLKDGTVQQRYLCRRCDKRFNDGTNKPMARLRTLSSIVAAAISFRREGLGVRPTGRSFDKSHSTIINWALLWQGAMEVC